MRCFCCQEPLISGIYVHEWGSVNMKCTILRIAGLPILMTIVAQSASAAVVGGETGDLTGWTVTGVDGAFVSGPPSYPVQTGCFDFVGDNTGFATLSQAVTTTAGSVYDPSFSSRTTETVTSTSSYANITSSFTAPAGGTTALNFYYETDPGTGIWSLDDNDVTASRVDSPAVPESLVVLCMLGAGA